MDRRSLTLLLFLLLITSLVPAPHTQVTAYRNFINPPHFNIHFWTYINDDVKVADYFNMTFKDWGWMSHSLPLNGALYSSLPLNGAKATIYAEINGEKVFMDLKQEYDFKFFKIQPRAIRTTMNFAYAKFDAQIPFWRDGTTITARGYSLTLLSTAYGHPKILIKTRNYTLSEVDWKKVELSIGPEYKNVTAYKFDYKNIHGFILARVPLFYGYLERKENITFYHRYNVIINDMFKKDDGERLINYINVTVEDLMTGKKITRIIQEGYSAYLGDLIVEFDNAIYDKYAEVTIKPIGALGYIYIGPDEEFKLYEGQSMNLIANILVKNYKTAVDYEVPKSLNYTGFIDPYEEYDTGYHVYGFADIGLKTPCQLYLTYGRLHDSPVGELLTYYGTGVAIDGTGEDKNGEYANVIVFYQYPEVPEPYNVSNLLVTLEVPRETTQYEPFNATLIIKNTANTTLKYAHLEFNLTNGFQVLNTSLSCEDKCSLTIPAGGEVKIPLKMIANKYGENLTVGQVIVKAKVPYQLACYGLQEINFTSNIPITTVERGRPVYRLRATLPEENITERQLFNITVNLTNTGNIDQRINLTIEKPKDIVIINPPELIDGQGYYNIAPNTTKLLNITLIGLRAGNYTINIITKNQKSVEDWKSISVEIKPLPVQIVKVNVTQPSNQTLPENQTPIENQTNTTPVNPPTGGNQTTIPPSNQTTEENQTTGNTTGTIENTTNQTTIGPNQTTGGTGGNEGTGGGPTPAPKFKQKSPLSNPKVIGVIIALIILLIAFIYIYKNYEIRFFYEPPEEEKEEGQAEVPEGGEIDLIPEEETETGELNVEELIPAEEEYEKTRSLIPAVPLKLKLRRHKEKTEESKEKAKEEEAQTTEPPAEEEKETSTTKEEKEELPENPIDIDL